MVLKTPIERVLSLVNVYTCLYSDLNEVHKVQMRLEQQSAVAKFAQNSVLSNMNLEQVKNHLLKDVLSLPTTSEEIPNLRSRLMHLYLCTQTGTARNPLLVLSKETEDSLLTSLATWVQEGSAFPMSEDERSLHIVAVLQALSDAYAEYCDDPDEGDDDAEDDVGVFFIPEDDEEDEEVLLECLRQRVLAYKLADAEDVNLMDVGALRDLLEDNLDDDEDYFEPYEDGTFDVDLPDRDVACPEHHALHMGEYDITDMIYFQTSDDLPTSLYSYLWMMEPDDIMRLACILQLNPLNLRSVYGPSQEVKVELGEDFDHIQYGNLKDVMIALNIPEDTNGGTHIVNYPLYNVIQPLSLLERTGIKVEPSVAELNTFNDMTPRNLRKRIQSWVEGDVVSRHEVWLASAMRH